ncbi:RNA 2'-phosphotransferase [Deinococcus humi]|uniref:Probable RNA 2'-phosphotransferase n=1 Tax=Deinococcus humi TaxID=662880 RepID=A0A7W8JV20_9DEIO|nr:RNA 2'-phosphotransferase [Deinococcus humi]MBB5363353.1 putative RNA 2'-phosphotransferase [Deinococcus humi]GGO26943.1 putative RNA 2'-phosphotransferase [Deinococcus humi]
MTEKQLSHLMSYLLRHAPHEAGLTLQPGGWVPLGPLLAHLNVTQEQVERVVAASDKQRFSLDGDRIRANQGHSVPVDLELTPQPPPPVLYHGTFAGALPAIRREGLRTMKRHHVHLSPDTGTAGKVGARRGAAVVLTVRAQQMHAAGHLFYRSENGVWLVEAVPAEFLDFP